MIWIYKRIKYIYKKSLTPIRVISPNWVDIPDKIRVIYKLAGIVKSHDQLE